MNKIITTTTNNLEGWSILEYHEPITANVVVGANVFSDFAASWTDFFGGRSNTNERRLQDIYKQAIDVLCTRARSEGANCIVGLRIDIDEITGKGTQMFMITALGTPVKAIKDGGEETGLNNGSLLDGHLVEKKVKARQIINRLQNDENAIYWIKQPEIDFINESQLTDFIDFVLWLYEKFGNNTDEQSTNTFRELSKYFGRIDNKLASDAIYNKIMEGDLATLSQLRLINLLNMHGMIDYKKINNVVGSPDFAVAKRGLILVEVEKSYYSEQDGFLLTQIKNTIKERFTPTVEVTIKKRMLSSSEKEVWVCNCGRTNNKEATHCEVCATDIYGFKKEETHPFAIIELIDNRLEVFEELVKKKTLK